ncbi:hypothetical protein Tco_1258299 [Tanacetum coccineum]
MTTFYHSLKDNWQSIFEKASIEGYYEENVDHREQTDKLQKARILELNRRYFEEYYSEESIRHIHQGRYGVSVPTLTKDHRGLSSIRRIHRDSIRRIHEIVDSLTAIESSQADIRSKISSLKSDTSEIKSMMTGIYQAFKGHSLTPSSIVPQTTLAITEGLANADKSEEEPTNAVPISTIKPTETQPITTIISISQPESSQAPKRTDKGKKIATDNVESLVKLVHASKVMRENPDEPIRVPYMINGKMYHLTNYEINKHLGKKDKIKMATEEAKRLEMTKIEVIKIVQEEAENIGIDPKKIISAKAGETFKKAQDAEMQVHKRQHTEKTKILMELNKNRAEQYKWTISNRLKLEPITDVKIYPNSKPAILSVYRLILVLENKRKHMELEPEIKVPRIFFTDVFGDQAFQRWNDIHNVRVDSIVSYLVMALMIKTLENAIFCLKLKKLIVEHPDQEKL